MGGAVSDVGVTVPGRAVDRRLGVRRPHRHARAARQRRQGDRAHRARAGHAARDLHRDRRRRRSRRTSSFAAGEPPTVDRRRPHLRARRSTRRPSAAPASRSRPAAGSPGSPSPTAGRRPPWPRTVAPVTGGRAAYAVASGAGGSRDDEAHLRPRGRRGGVVAAMPHQKAGLAAGTTCDLGTFPSVYGTLSVCRGDIAGFTAPVRAVSPPLDLGSLSDADKASPGRPGAPGRGRHQGRSPPTRTSAARRSTASAQLLPAGDPARADGRRRRRSRPSSSSSSTSGPTRRAATQRPAFCFVYDPAGQGSDRADAVVRLRRVQRPPLPLRLLPLHRGPARGRATRRWPRSGSRSWTSSPPTSPGPATGGCSPTGAPSTPTTRTPGPAAPRRSRDGNNQESTSEAVTAWTGLSLWADATKNEPLRTEATWMLAGEQQTALLYGLRARPQRPGLPGFGHQIVSLNWGGKRDYATWFSPAPAAMLAILVLPASPSSAAYLGGDADTDPGPACGGDDRSGLQPAVRRLPAHVCGPGREAGAAAALKQATTPGPKWVDDGNSRAYLWRGS